MKFIFENKSKVTISGITSDSSVDSIVQAWLYPGGDRSYLQVMCGVDWVNVTGSIETLCQESVYRVIIKPSALETAIDESKEIDLDGNRGYKEIQLDFVEIIRKLAKSLGVKS